VSSVSHFAQGDIFSPTYYNDTTTHGHRLRRLAPYHGPADPITDFVRVLIAALMVRGDVAELAHEQALILNDRHNGMSPRNSARIGRTFYTLLQPLYLMSALRKVNLAWTSDTTDDTLATTWNPKSWLTLLTDGQSAGAVSADNLALLSATTNSGSIASIALTGTVGGLTASATQPVLELTGNTLVDGDKINVTNLTGSAGTWPGTGLRNGVVQIAKGTGRPCAGRSGQVGDVDLVAVHQRVAGQFQHRLRRRGCQPAHGAGERNGRDAAAVCRRGQQREIVGRHRARRLAIGQQREPALWIPSGGERVVGRVGCPRQIDLAQRAHQVERLQQGVERTPDAG
jgi:hypothetical protein